MNKDVAIAELNDDEKPVLKQRWPASTAEIAAAKCSSRSSKPEVVYQPGPGDTVITEQVRSPFKDTVQPQPQAVADRSSQDSDVARSLDLAADQQPTQVTPPPQPTAPLPQIPQIPPPPQIPEQQQSVPEQPPPQAEQNIIDQGDQGEDEVFFSDTYDNSRN